jgi:O-antigen/teichoic acid export membrane protein
MLADLVRRISKSAFWRNVSILTGGTVVAQAIMVLALPILTRLYSPHDFNLLAVFTSTLGLLSVASCLRFNVALSLPRDDRTAMDLLGVALISGIFFAVLTAIPAFFAPRWFAGLLGQSGLKSFLWLLPIAVLFSAAYEALQFWASRKKRFVAITQTRMTRAIGGVGAQLVFGVAGQGPFGLLLGQTLLSGLGFLGLARSVLTEDRKALIETRFEGLKGAARAYRRFPLYSVPEALFNTAGLELSILVIAAMAVGPEAGFLMLAMRVIGIPMNFIGASVAQVCISEAPSKHDAGELGVFTKQMMITLFKVGAVPMLAVGTASPFLFPLIFGEEWARAGVILAWLTPMFILNFVVSPVSIVVHVTNKTILWLWMQIAACLVRVGGLLIVAKLDPKLLVEVFAVLGAGSYLASIIFVHQIARSGQKV